MHTIAFQSINNYTWDLKVLQQTKQFFYNLMLLFLYLSYLFNLLLKYNFEIGFIFILPDEKQFRYFNYFYLSVGRYAASPFYQALVWLHLGLLFVLCLRTDSRSAIKQQAVRWVWVTRLFTIPAYFFKIIFNTSPQGSFHLLTPLHSGRCTDCSCMPICG